MVLAGPNPKLVYGVISGAIYVGVIGFLIWNYASVDRRDDEAGE
jgi:hypothetical protein